MVTEVRFHDQVWLTHGWTTTYKGPHARWSRNTWRGDGIEIWESDDEMTFVPTSNILYVKEARNA